MIKAIRRIAALATLLVVALKGVLTFLSWVEKQEEVETVWAVDEEFLSVGNRLGKVDFRYGAEIDTRTFWSLWWTICS